MTARRILRLGIFQGAARQPGHECRRRTQRRSRPQTPPATAAPGEGGATTSTLRVEVRGLHLRILRSDLAGEVPWPP